MITDNNINSKEVIDLRDVIKQLLSRKKMFAIVWAITFIVSCLLILPVPRTYQAYVSLAPETTDLSNSSLSSIASSFGFNMNNMTTTDAFYPDIYPDVIASNEFISELMNVKVKSKDGTVCTDYYTYLKQHQKQTAYMVPLAMLQNLITDLFKKTKVSGGEDKIDPFMLSDNQTQLFDLVRNQIECSVDKKTGVVSINVTDQDPLICATMADSARAHLQNYIIRYRTNKARIDCEYYEKLLIDAKKEYDDAILAYSRFCDSHNSVILQTESSKRDALENEMSLKLNAYNQLNNQLSLAKAKLQEATPAFSILQGATVPVKAKGPKRVIFILVMMLLTTFGTMAFIFKNAILKNMMKA